MCASASTSSCCARNSACPSQITFLRTQDLQRSARFYEEQLGLTLALDQGSCRIYKVQGAAFIGLCSSDGPPKTESVIFTLVTPDVDGWHQRLHEAGVPVDGPPRYNEKYQITQFFACDPDGYQIEIQRFEDPRWPSAAPIS